MKGSVLARRTVPRLWGAIRKVITEMALVVGGYGVVGGRRSALAVFVLCEVGEG